MAIKTEIRLDVGRIQPQKARFILVVSVGRGASSFRGISTWKRDDRPGIPSRQETAGKQALFRPGGDVGTLRGRPGSGYFYDWGDPQDWPEASEPVIASRPTLIPIYLLHSVSDPPRRRVGQGGFNSDRTRLRKVHRRTLTRSNGAGSPTLMLCFGQHRKLSNRQVYSLFLMVFRALFSAVLSFGDYSIYYT